jgi:reductive dehalogenase
MRPVHVTPQNGQIDERTIMFSRAELVPGTDRYDSYYRLYPEHLEQDLAFREHPGLLKPGTTFFNPLIFNAAKANFSTVEQLSSLVDGEANGERMRADRASLKLFIQNWCKTQGAHSVGVTLLKDRHLYSYGGRKQNYGEPVQNSHPLAIVFTVEMDYRRTKMAPRSPITLESSAQYLHSAKIAVNLAQMIRSMGYSARAHIDGNYQVRCPQLARDAGLGEIGRMSLLITPKLGPRVRIAAVTTDLPLECDTRVPDNSVIDFCTKCKKCAVNCPASAISSSETIMQGGDPGMNQTACYTYWCRIGTDCGRCMSVCPYSHGNTAIHRAARFLARHSGVFRSFAVVLDDLLYGRRPRFRKMDRWM